MNMLGRHIYFFLFLVLCTTKFFVYLRKKYYFVLSILSLNLFVNNIGCMEAWLTLGSLINISEDSSDYLVS